MKVKELTERTGTYKPYEDPNAKGPNGEALLVDLRGRVGYWKQQGRARNFIAYDPKAQQSTTVDQPEPDALTAMQGTPMSDPGSPEAQKALTRTLLSLLPGIGTALDVEDAIAAAKKGELGDAATASVFAALGLIPVVGAPGRAALKAAKEFVQNTPGFLQRAKGIKPAPARVDPPLDPAPGSVAAHRAQIDKAYPPPATGSSGRVEPQLGNTATTGANRLDPRVDPPPIKPEADPARIATLAGVTTAAGTAGKLAGKGDEVSDIARVANASDTTADAGRAARAADDVPTATVAKTADEVPAAASAARTAGKGDDVADASRATNKVDDAAAAGKRSDDIKGAAPVAAAGGRLASKADNVADAGKLTRAQRAAIAGGAAAGAAGIGYLANKPNSAADSTGQAAMPADKPNLDTLSFGQAFAQARRLAAQQGRAGQGQFTWRGKQYQTNIEGEPYVAADQQIKINESDLLFRIKSLIK